MALINTRVVGSKNGPKEEDIPPGIAYATATNLDRCSINDGIFAKHLEQTHSKHPDVPLPLHTVCIKASNLKWVKKGEQVKNFNAKMKDLFYATVCEAQCRTADRDQKLYDPMLKLYHGCPLMINSNFDVQNCIANGTMCKFEGIILKDGVAINDLEKICIDGFYVRCASVSQIHSIKLKLIDGLTHPEEERSVELSPKSKTVTCSIPISLDGEVHRNTYREKRKLKLEQFPVNVSHARTIHKLQGRSLDNIFISSWDYRDNWIYVALSRVKTLRGLFLRMPLDHKKCKPMPFAVRDFMEKMRSKQPPTPVELPDEKRARLRYQYHD